MNQMGQQSLNVRGREGRYTAVERSTRGRRCPRCERFVHRHEETPTVAGQRPTSVRTVGVRLPWEQTRARRWVVEKGCHIQRRFRETC